MKKVIAGGIGILLSLLALSYADRAQAYGEAGHRLICETALAYTQPQTQATIAKLVAAAAAEAGEKYRSFGQLCGWPDDARRLPEYQWTAPHHYVNFARDAAQVTAADCPAQGCILFALDHYQAVLRQAKGQPSYWQALAFFSHYMGDLHQPLHVSFSDDLGGNRAPLTFKGQPSNLHALWDTLLLNEQMRRRELDYFDYLAWLQQGLAALELSKGETFLAWANESASITRKLYSEYRRDISYGDAYVDEYGALTEHRVQEAAVRLAQRLDALFADSIENEMPNN